MLDFGLLRIKQRSFFLQALYVLLMAALMTGCASKRKLVQEKQIEWRVQCEATMLKGGAQLQRHHDCFKRCQSHYRHYCKRQCLDSLEGAASVNDVTKTCSSFMEGYVSRKCHYVCDLTPQELTDYRRSFLKKVTEQELNASACQTWDRTDILNMQKDRDDPLDDSMNTFRRGAQSYRRDLKNQRREDSSEENYRDDEGGRSSRGSSARQGADDDDDDDDDVGDNDEDDSDSEEEGARPKRQRSQTGSRKRGAVPTPSFLRKEADRKNFTQGFDPIAKISLPMSQDSLRQIAQQARKVKGGNKVESLFEALPGILGR